MPAYNSIVFCFRFFIQLKMIVVIMCMKKKKKRNEPIFSKSITKKKKIGDD